MTCCLVCDLGAGSGRVMLARHEDDRLELEEIHRFEGYAVDREDGPHWDVPRLLGEIDAGLARARDIAGRIDSIGVDSWGLDYALIEAAGTLVGEPCHYRHPRSRRGWEACALSADALFALTGAQELPVNTVYQLSDEVGRHPERHAEAKRLLMIADVVNHHLTGSFRSELTLARTSGLLAAETDGWSREICDRIGLDARLLQPMIRPGETYGLLRTELAARLGWDRVPVIAVAAHDPASAVAALSLGDGSGFLICGSWSLIGVEQERIDRRAVVRAAGFGNEGGTGGRPFLVRSLNGLHLVQKLRDTWRGRTGLDLSFADLSRRAAEVTGDAASVSIDPADQTFFNPPDMLEAIARFCAASGQTVPGDPGEFARAIYNGLAAEAGAAVAALEKLIDRTLPGLKLCGGGARDALLCALIATATGKALRIGPIEASAWGNALVQLVGLGVVASLEDGRRLVERSAEFRELLPTDPQTVAHAGG